MGRDLFRPPDPLPVSEWAARFFHIDKTSPSPGLYDPTTTPWINAILDEYPDPNLTQIVLRASAQSSKAQENRNSAQSLLSEGDQTRIGSLVWPATAHQGVNPRFSSFIQRSFLLQSISNVYPQTSEYGG